MPTVPDSSLDPSLLDWGKAYLKETRSKPGNVFLGVVHRIDRPVSGVVCLAITSKAAGRLSEQIRQKQVKKTYLAVVDGRPSRDHMTLTHIIRKNHKRNRVTVFPPDQTGKGKLAVTKLRLLDRSGRFCLLELTPVTGRPHQLRAQCAHVGFPIVGDLKYGAKRPLKNASIALHAVSLEIRHPTRAERLVFQCPPPSDWPWSLFGGYLSRCSFIALNRSTIL